MIWPIPRTEQASDASNQEPVLPHPGTAHLTPTERLDRARDYVMLMRDLRESNSERRDARQDG